MEPEPKEPEPTLQEKIAILQSRFRGISWVLQKSIPLVDYWITMGTRRKRLVSEMISRT